MPTVSKREAARRDLVEHFVYLAANASMDVADRFLSCAESSFADLAQQPMMGSQLALKHPVPGPHPQMAGEGFRQSLDILRTAP